MATIEIGFYCLANTTYYCQNCLKYCLKMKRVQIRKDIKFKKRKKIINKNLNLQFSSQ